MTSNINTLSKIIEGFVVAAVVDMKLLDASYVGNHSHNSSVEATSQIKRHMSLQHFTIRCRQREDQGGVVCGNGTTK